MAAQDPPRSPAGIRADRAAEKAKRSAVERQRKADQIKADELKREQQARKQEQRKLSWGRDWAALDKQIRELGRRERELRRKKYD